MKQNTESLLQEQKLQLDAALDNIAQGLCMFDAQGHVVLFNQQYADMIGIPADGLTGRPLIDLFHQRTRMGTFVGDPAQYCESIMRRVRAGQRTTRTTETPNGFAFRILEQPMANGGWVTTLEDITEQRKIERERHQDREFLKQIIEHVPVMITVKEAASRRFVLANRAAEAFWGISREQAIGKTVHELFSEAQANIIDATDVAAMACNGPLTLESHPIMSRSDDKRIVASKRLAIRDDDGEPKFLLSVVEDVTERKALEQQREQDWKLMTEIINNVPAIILVKDARTRQYVLINRAGEQYFGASRREIVGKTADELWPAATAKLIAEHDDRLMTSDGYLFFDEQPIDTFGRGSRFITAKRLILRDGQGEPAYLLGVIEDVTDQRHARERVTHLAHHDALTGLPNRMFFRTRLEAALRDLRDGRKLAVLYFDLDQFKTVNDALGHPVGDELLKQVAERLRGALGDDGIVARLGGDEFAIVQTGLGDASEVAGLVERIRRAVRQPYRWDGHELSTDASIGIALAPDDGSDPDQLLKNADLAMYAAKAAGRGANRFYRLEMDARMQARRALELDLREAVMRGGFELYYQPLVRLEDGAISGCEALIRWPHATRGMVPPAEFIPVAEETGLITVLGEWVLRTACAEAADWPDHIKVAVNISPVQFRGGNLVQMVVNALASSRLPAARLELEITEAVLIRDDEATLAMLHQLRALGVRIALDDFGTGYSSLSYLHRFPFDKIKIDRSFIKDIDGDVSTLPIVQAVVGIAESRNMTTTAEGVETQSQLGVLRRAGCTEMQGYLFSRPVPAPDVMRLLLSRRERQEQVA